MTSRGTTSPCSLRGSSMRRSQSAVKATADCLNRRGDRLSYTQARHTEIALFTETLKVNDKGNILFNIGDGQMSQVCMLIMWGDIWTKEGGLNP